MPPFLAVGLANRICHPIEVERDLAALSRNRMVVSHLLDHLRVPEALLEHPLYGRFQTRPGECRHGPPERVAGLREKRGETSPPESSSRVDLRVALPGLSRPRSRKRPVRFETGLPSTISRRPKTRHRRFAHGADRIEIRRQLQRPIEAFDGLLVPFEANQRVAQARVREGVSDVRLYRGAVELEGFVESSQFPQGLR